MTWTKPPPPLDHVHYTDLAAGTLLYRCYRLENPENGFWASQGVRYGAHPRRMLYTGTEDAAAVAETILRAPQVLPGTNHLVLPFDHAKGRGIATLRLTRAVKFIDLRRPACFALLEATEHRAELRKFHERTRNYGPTEELARDILKQAPETNALAWPSRRVDAQTVYCFYEGPLTAADFTVEAAVPFNSVDGAARLRAAIKTLGLVWINAPTIAGAIRDDD